MAYLRGFLKSLGNAISNFGNAISNFGNAISNFGNAISNFGNAVSNFCGSLFLGFLPIFAASFLGVLLSLLSCPFLLRDRERTRQIPRYYHRMPSDCFQSGIALAELLPVLKTALLQELEDFTVTIQTKQELIDLAPLKRRLTELQQREKKIYEAFECGVYTMQVFLERRDEIESLIKDQLQSIALAEETNASYTDPDLLTMSVHQAIQEIGVADPLIVNEFLRGFIARIDYSRESRKPPVLKIWFKNQSS